MVCASILYRLKKIDGREAVCFFVLSGMDISNGTNRILHLLISSISDVIVHFIKLYFSSILNSYIVKYQLEAQLHWPIRS